MEKEIQNFSEGVLEIYINQYTCTFSSREAYPARRQKQQEKMQNILALVKVTGQMCGKG